MSTALSGKKKNMYVLKCDMIVCLGKPSLKSIIKGFHFLASSNIFFFIFPVRASPISTQTLDFFFLFFLPPSFISVSVLTAPLNLLTACLRPSRCPARCDF